MFAGIEACDTFVVFGTAGYGQDTVCLSVCLSLCLLSMHVRDDAAAGFAVPLTSHHLHCPSVIAGVVGQPRLHILREQVCPEQRQANHPHPHDSVRREIRASPSTTDVRGEQDVPDLDGGRANARDHCRRHPQGDRRPKHGTQMRCKNKCRVARAPFTIPMSSKCLVPRETQHTLPHNIRHTTYSMQHNYLWAESALSRNHAN